MIDLSALKAFVIARLQESSTWRGLILIATAGFGWQVPPERQEAIVLGGLLLAGMVAVAFPDRRTPRPPRAPDDGQESGEGGRP